MLRTLMSSAVALALLLAAAVVAPPAAANEALIRKALLERMPKLRIDEIQRTPVEGIWEVRYSGTEILYSDARGEHLFVGASLIEMKTQANLTADRLEQLLAVPWAALPLKDAIVYRQGLDKRRMAVFADPMCGFCRQFEIDLAALKDTTIHVFVLPILGTQSNALARDIWCAREPAAAWRLWMIEQQRPPKAAADCNVQGIERNVAFSRAHKIDSTPTSFFEAGARKSGALRPAELERAFVSTPGAARKPS
jgi:thiol:disulfide interchange protein DsbC